MNVLHTLADAGPHEAPERVEIALREAFRRHHRVRRLRRATIAAGATAAAAAAIALFVHLPGPVGRPAPVAFHPAPPPMAWVKSKPPVEPVPVHKTRRRPSTDQMAATEFVALPYGDDSLVEESATIVRVELPRSALRLAGFNVAQERAGDRIQADVVLGADGLAHAVRFVNYLE
jgi:hypothetical protein